MSEIHEAIIHAVRAVQRRAEGLAKVADCHSAAAKRALDKIAQEASR